MPSLDKCPHYVWRPPHDYNLFETVTQDITKNSFVIDNIARYMRSRYRFIYMNGIFWMYNDDKGMWNTAEDFVFNNRINDFLVRYNAVKTTPALIDNVRRRLQDMIMEESKWNKDRLTSRRNWINFQNGMLNMTDMELYPHHPEYYSFYQIPFKYDSNADCPKWKQFIDFCTNNNEDIQLLLQRFIAYIISDDITIHKYLHLIGNAGTGKSKFIETVFKLIGKDKSIVIDVADDKDNFPLDALIGKKFIMMDEWEVPHLTPQAEKTLKLLGAFGMIRVKRKYTDSESIQNVAKLIVGSNNFPHVSDASNAIFRRLILIKFDRIIPPNLQHEFFDTTNSFETEMPGIINWALQEYHSIMTMGAYAFNLPPVCEAWIKEIREYSNHIMAWANECVILYDNLPTDPLEAKMIAYEKTEDLYKNYKDWCDKVDLRFQHRLNMITFSRKFKQAFAHKVSDYRTNNSRGFIGVKLHNHL